MGRTYVIGLAGGIGSGKSTVAAQLGRLGAEVLDADVMVHELLREPGVIRRVVRRFGKDVLGRRGTINREKLGRLAFTSGKDIRELEKLLHPGVVRRVKRRIAELRRRRGKHVVVIDAPLLFEAGMHRLCDEIVFVHAPKLERLKRLRETRGWSRTTLENREKLQKPLNYKRRNADTVVRNAKARSETNAQVRRLWKRVHELLNG